MHRVRHWWLMRERESHANNGCMVGYDWPLSLIPVCKTDPVFPLGTYHPPGRNFLTLKVRTARVSEKSVSTCSPTRWQNPEFIYQYQTREPGMLPAYMWDVPSSNPSHNTDYIRVFFFICSVPPDIFCGSVSNYVTTSFWYNISDSLATVILLF